MSYSDNNLDSFVDIVTNTAGILVVLVVLSILHSEQVGIRYNPKLRELTNIDDSIAERKQELSLITSSLAHEEARATRAEEELATSLVKLSDKDPEIARFTDARERAAALAREEEENGERSVALTQLTAKRWELLAQAQRTIAASDDDLGDLDPKSRAMVLDTPLAKLREDLKRLRSQADDATVEAVRLKGSRDELQKQTWRESRELEVLRAQEMDIRSYRPRASLSQRHFAECYVPAKALDVDGVLRPAVRFVDPGRFARDGGTLSPQADGESAFRLTDSNSRYRAFLGTHGGAYRKKHHLHFVVRPDAYVAFRVARKLARESGWHVEWSPAD